MLWRKQHWKFTIFCVVVLLVNVLYFTSIRDRDVWRSKRHRKSKKLQLPVFKNRNYQSNSTKDIPRILFWTPFFGHNDFVGLHMDDLGFQAETQYCDYNCEYTFDKELLRESDAILFHGRDIDTYRIESNGEIVSKPSNIPDYRSSSQYWILYLFESPTNTGSLDAFDRVFNLTMTYRTDSDIYVPYQRLVEIPTTEKKDLLDYEKLIQKKTKMVAWIVSDCDSSSKRELVMNQLKEYIQVDVYGACGEYWCPEKDLNHMSCYDRIGESYKFYLAFENSLCVDYVTEKFFNAMDAGMVPIVYGSANYSQHAPKGSYIDVNTFKSMKDLAKYLLKLDKDDKLYLSYFEWRKRFQVESFSIMQRAWCTLCQKLSTEQLPQTNLVTNLKSWWFQKGSLPACTSPHENLFTS